MDIADKVDALTLKVDALATAVAALAAPAAVNLQPVLDAVAAVSAKLESTPTPPPAAPPAA